MNGVAERAVYALHSPAGTVLEGVGESWSWRWVIVIA
jgi:hypothetical protein